MILTAIASMPTFNEGMTEFPAHFALLKLKRKKCSLTVGKIPPLITVNKQALFWKFKTQTNQVSRCVNQVSRICLPIFKFIEQWAPRNVARAAKFLS